ncbi:MAG: phage tail protein [Massilia sp.]
MARQDPLHGFRFLVEIDGIAAAGFMRVKGVAREVRVESVREGGVNDYEHKLFTQVSYANLVLERGLAQDTLWNWALAVSNGDIERKTITVSLQDHEGASRWTWHVDHAYPVKWSVSDLDANTSQVTMESVEFAHHGLRRGA